VIALVDYGAGNLTSVRKALSTLGAGFITPDSPGALASARGVIVPGVGHFAATAAIDREWREAIRAVLDQGGSLFGICLGMQWLFDGSDEAPGLPGLGVIAGHCTRLQPAPGAAAFKVPHVGWNSLDAPRPSTLLQGVTPGAQVYFTHSYVAPVVEESAALTHYGVTFTAGLERGRVAGVQFHPEKSGDVGLRVLSNWLNAL
jgi:glutamine amidotransferase